MKKIYTVVTMILLLLVSVFNSNEIKAEKLEITDFTELVSFMTGDELSATITESFECESVITVLKNKTLYLEDDIVITAPSNVARMFKVGKNKTLKILAAGEEKSAVIKGPSTLSKAQDCGMFVYVDNGATLEIKGFTIKDFACLEEANISGTILNDGGTLKLDDIKFINNSVTLFGGSILSKNGDAEIKNSYFEGNVSTHPNGGYAGGVDFEYGTLTIENTTFKDNSSNGYGGALYITNADATIDGCTFEGNKAYDGSAIYCIDSTAHITNSTIKNNSSFDAAALYVLDSTVNIDATSLTKNAARYGSALVSSNAEVIIGDNTSIVDNTLTQYTAVELWGVGKLIFDGKNIALNNFHEDGNKDDIYTFGSEYFYVKKDATFKYPIAISTEDMVAKNTIKTVLKDGYEGKLLDVFVSARGNMNLTETIDGLFITGYGITSEPNFENKYTVTVDDVRDTNIKVSYQWYSQKISNSEKLKYKGNYTLFTSLELNNNVSNSNGTYTYNSDYYPEFMKLKGLKKGQILQFDIKTKATNPTTTFVYIIDEDGKTYNELNGDGSKMTYRVTIPHDGDFTVYAYIGSYEDYDYTAVVSNAYVMNVEKETKISDKDNKLSSFVLSKEAFCRVTFKNGNATTSFDTDHLYFGEVVSGDNQKIIFGNSEALDFTLPATNAQYNDFVNNGVVYLDGIDDEDILEVDKDYIYSKGSINISISPDLISKLTLGKHYIYVLENTKEDSKPIVKLTKISFKICREINTDYVVVNTCAK